MKEILSTEEEELTMAEKGKKKGFRLKKQSVVLPIIKNGKVDKFVDMDGNEV